MLILVEVDQDPALAFASKLNSVRVLVDVRHEYVDVGPKSIELCHYLVALIIIQREIMPHEPYDSQQPLKTGQAIHMSCTQPIAVCEDS